MIRPNRAAIVLLLLYGLSGVTALAYEVLWTRMLSLLFGTTILGVVITVAAFMLGLGLGSFFGYRWQVSLKNSLRILAAIEVSVAIYALLLPLLMQLLQSLWVSVDSVQAWQFWQMSSALWVLSLPAMALGFAFPWMLRVGKCWGLSLGQLYGVNTIGGAVGALLPLFLLPLAGWMLSLQWVAGLGIAVGLGFLWLSMRREYDEKQRGVHAVKVVSASYPPLSLLLAYAGMGAGALMLEIAWTRAYGMVLLRTEYVLGVILALFLVGIGLGSVLARRLPREIALRWMPMLVAALALLGLYAFPYVNQWGQAMVFDSLFTALLFQGMLIALFTLPVTLAFGAWLPLISRHDDGAVLYAANSVGASVGVLLAGFLFIPWLGTATTWLLAAAVVMCCGCYWVSAGKRLLHVTVAMLLFVAFAWPVQQLPAASVLLQHELPGAIDLYQNEDAISITHVVQRTDGQRLLLADLQRMDAASDPTSVEVQKNQARLPLFLHDSAEDVLFLGLGTGITAAGALAWPGVSLSAVELSQGAIVAAQTYFDEVNDKMDAVALQHDDARRFLMRTTNYYDVIIGDLFHPDMVGRGALLSVEQFERVKGRLNNRGLFVQWLAFNQFDVASLQVVLRSFAQAFPHNALFVDGYRMGLVGFKGSSRSASQLMAAAPSPDQWGGEGGWTWLGRYWGDVSLLLSDAKGSAVQGEWTPVIEFSLPELRYADAALPDVLGWLFKYRVPLSKAVEAWSVSSADMHAFKRAWAATSLNMQAQWLSLQDKPGAERLQSLAYRANPEDRWAGFALADAMFATLEQGLPQGLTYEQALQKILEIRPDHEGALRAMLQRMRERNDAKGIKYYQETLYRISPYGRLPA